MQRKDTRFDIQVHPLQWNVHSALYVSLYISLVCFAHTSKHTKKHMRPNIQEVGPTYIQGRLYVRDTRDLRLRYKSEIHLLQWLVYFALYVFTYKADIQRFTYKPDLIAFLTCFIKSWGPPCKWAIVYCDIQVRDTRVIYKADLNRRSNSTFQVSGPACM